jgi:hypothetical protein
MHEKRMNIGDFYDLACFNSFNLFAYGVVVHTERSTFKVGGNPCIRVSSFDSIGMSLCLRRS